MATITQNATSDTRSTAALYYVVRACVRCVVPSTQNLNNNDLDLNPTSIVSPETRLYCMGMGKFSLIVICCSQSGHISTLNHKTRANIYIGQSAHVYMYVYLSGHWGHSQSLSCCTSCGPHKSRGKHTLYSLWRILVLVLRGNLGFPITICTFCKVLWLVLKKSLVCLLMSIFLL